MPVIDTGPVTKDEFRTGPQRKADTLAMLQAPAADVWVASASIAESATSESGLAQAHLVPLSLAWTGDRAVIALDPTSLTARNIIESGRARLALGHTRDVVIIDVALDKAIDMSDLSAELADQYAEQAGWDPRAAGGRYLFIVLRPDRIQAWREANEQAKGRTLMRDGAWIV